MKLENGNHYASTKFEQWVSFLENFDLVKRVNESLEITDKGRQFLGYLVATGSYDPVAP